MSAPVLSWLFYTLGTVQAHPLPFQGKTKGVQGTRLQSPLVLTSSRQRPLGPTLRANPFPEVTDLFCRLPLPTLFYQLEAANLGDLMRLSVRPGVQISNATRVSRDNESAPKQTKAVHLSQDSNPISGQSNSRASVLVKKKRELSLGLPPPFLVLLVLPLNIHILVLEC